MEDIKAIADAQEICFAFSRASRVLADASGTTKDAPGAFARAIKLDKLKSYLEKSKLIADSRQRLNDRPEKMTQQEEMARIQKRIDRTGNHLDDAQQVMIESEAIAQNITSNLQVQREQLVNARTNVDDAREDADEASAHLESLKRKHQWQIVSLYFIIVVLFAHCVYRLIKFLT
ncbi:hypothetical protein PINS_up024533 [Pythium insidiosum]|nr:hypothetical protein PINS_up024533 [Pythium insidiosum]